MIVNEDVTLCQRNSWRRSLWTCLQRSLPLTCGVQPQTKGPVSRYDFCVVYSTAHTADIYIRLEFRQGLLNFNKQTPTICELSIRHGYWAKVLQRGTSSSEYGVISVKTEYAMTPIGREPTHQHAWIGSDTSAFNHSSSDTFLYLTCNAQ